MFIPSYTWCQKLEFSSQKKTKKNITFDTTNRVLHRSSESRSRKKKYGGNTRIQKGKEDKSIFFSTIGNKTHETHTYIFSEERETHFALHGENITFGTHTHHHHHLYKNLATELISFLIVRKVFIFSYLHNEIL